MQERQIDFSAFGKKLRERWRLNDLSRQNLNRGQLLKVVIRLKSAATVNRDSIDVSNR